MPPNRERKGGCGPVREGQWFLGKMKWALREDGWEVMTWMVWV